LGDFDALGLDKVTDGVNEGKTVIFDEKTHVESIFVLFWFPRSSGCSDMARCEREPFLTFWDLLVLVWVSKVVRDTEGEVWTSFDSDEGSWLMYQLV